MYDNLSSDDNLKLQTSISSFEEHVVKACNEHSPASVITEAMDINEAREVYNKWFNFIFKYYSDSFSIKDNFFTNELKKVAYSAIDANDSGISKSNNDIVRRYERIKSQLLLNLRQIKACEMLYADPIRESELRSQDLTVEEKLQLILNKLYSIRSDRQFSIYKLLVWNGVKIIRKGEPTELAQQLKTKGLISVEPSAYRYYFSDYESAFAKITSKGEQHVERSNKQIAKINSSPKSNSTNRSVASKNIFIVHGHDKSTRIELKALLKDEFKLNPIILSEQPMATLSTIFQKIDAHARDCVAAIVLMTPDDKVGDESRARENVLLELGYFIGLFSPGDRKVLILRKGEANIPSDILGVERIDFKDSIEEVHLKLTKQFKFWGLIK